MTNPKTAITLIGIIEVRISTINMIYYPVFVFQREFAELRTISNVLVSANQIPKSTMGLILTIHFVPSSRFFKLWLNRYFKIAMNSFKLFALFSSLSSSTAHLVARRIKQSQTIMKSCLKMNLSPRIN